MSTWAGVAPAIGTGSLDGFAIGALMSGACVLGITAPRRAQARHVPRARAGAVVAERSGWLCEHVMAAEVAGTGVSAEAFGAGAERLARPEEPGALGDGRSAAGREGRAGGRYRSRHRLGDPISDGAPWDGVSPDIALAGSAFPASAFPGTSWNGAQPGNAFSGGAFRADGSAGGAFPAWGSLRGADPGVTFPDKALADRAFESPKRREVRRLPQHAAPSVSFSSRVAGFGSRISSLFPARALASGARG